MLVMLLDKIRRIKVAFNILIATAPDNQMLRICRMRMMRLKRNKLLLRLQMKVMSLHMEITSIITMARCLLMPLLVKNW